MPCWINTRIQEQQEEAKYIHTHKERERERERCMELAIVSLCGMSGRVWALGSLSRSKVLSGEPVSANSARKCDEREKEGMSTERHNGKRRLPVLEYSAISSIGNEFMRELSHFRVQVVHNHYHHRSRYTDDHHQASSTNTVSGIACANNFNTSLLEGRGVTLLAIGRIQIDWVGLHPVVGGSESVHVNMTVHFQLLSELGGQFSMHFGRKVAKGVGNGQFLVLVA